MNDKYKNLEESFDIDTEILPTTNIINDHEIKPLNQNLIQNSNEIKKDYEYTRGNLYSIIEKGQEALSGALELATEGGQPRAYEVVGQLIKNVSDATDKLLDLQKKFKEIEEPSKYNKQTNVTNNALFVGSTAELSKFLKSSKKSLEND